MSGRGAVTADRRQRDGGRSDGGWRASLDLYPPVLAAIAVCLAVIGSFVLSQSTWRGVLVMPVLALLAAPVIRWATPEGGSLRSLLWAGFAFKGIAVFFRFLMVTDWYETGDSLRYARFAEQVGPQIRNLDFSWSAVGKVPGTGFQEIVTAVVYAVFGSDLFTGFLVFAFLSWVGTVGFFVAVRVAWPAADAFRYGLLVFFWPTLVFWPSAIGKDAWMVFTVGLAAAGAAHMLSSARRGYVLFALGVAGATMVRPHIAVVFVASLLVAFVVGAIGRQPSGRGSRAGRFVAAFAVLVAAAVVAPVVADQFGVDLSTEGLEEVLSETNRRTTQGGSEFTPAKVNQPLDYPWALVTVVARPFLFEANSVQTLISAVEGAVSLSVRMVVAALQCDFCEVGRGTRRSNDSHYG